MAVSGKWEEWLEQLPAWTRLASTELALALRRTLPPGNWQLSYQQNSERAIAGKRWIFQRSMLRRYFSLMQKHQLNVACVESFPRDWVLFQIQEGSDCLKMAIRSGKEVPRDLLLSALKRFIHDRLRERERSGVGPGMDAMYLARLAHDLRAPLSSLSLLLETIHASHPEIKLIDNCLRQCDILEQLTFDITSLESGRLPLEERREALLLSTIIEETLRAFADHLEKRSIHLDCNFSREKPVSTVRSHAGRIINNLIFNAIKFCSSPGQINIEIRPRENGVELHLEDSGPGLSGSSETMFSLFRSNLGRSASGWGLGLASARTLAERSGGSLSMVQGEQLRGARFILYLPDRPGAPD